MMWLNIAVVGMLLVLMPIFDRGQAGQTAFIILMATDIILAAYYLKVALRKQEVVKKKTGGRTSKGKSKNKNSKIIIRKTEK